MKGGQRREARQRLVFAFLDRRSDDIEHRRWPSTKDSTISFLPDCPGDKEQQRVEQGLGRQVDPPPLLYPPLAEFLYAVRQ